MQPANARLTRQTAARKAARKANEFYSIPRRYPGQTIFVLAGGPSLAGQPLERIAGRPTVAVNLSYSVAPWADYVYAQDGRFLRHHRKILEHRFPGRVVSVSRKEGWAGLHHCKKVEPSVGWPMRPNELAARRTSLAGAITLAAHLTGPGGSIVLLGADGGRAADGRSHHHAVHPWPVVDDSWQRHAIDLGYLKPGLAAAGITVTNCSPGSRWGFLWPIVSLADYLDSEAKGMSVESWRREEKRARYQAAFAAEAARVYPEIDALVAELGGHELQYLPFMAADLACPLKANPPNWQHGRVLYALARNYLVHARDSALVNEGALWPRDEFLFLDIGTAKGFSALCLFWALCDADAVGRVYSFDVVDPYAVVERNSVAELDGLKTLAEFIEPHMPRMNTPKAALRRLCFYQQPGMLFDALLPEGRRINLAFVDGKHKRTDVLTEATKIAARQGPGDCILFDDAQIPGVQDALAAFYTEKRKSQYDLRTIRVNALRSYCLAERLQ